MKIITNQLAEKLSTRDKLLNNLIINPLDFVALHSTLKNKKKIIIYDLTYSKKHPKYHELTVNNHINCTGKNPLIYKMKNNNNFLDLTQLYKYTENSVITHCCGHKLNTQYNYPSHYLCHVSILARSLGVQEIRGALVNIL